MLLFVPSLYSSVVAAVNIQFSIVWNCVERVWNGIVWNLAARTFLAYHKVLGTLALWILILTDCGGAAV